MADFEKAFINTMGYEGGYVYDPDDAGGETYKGISRRYHPSWPGWRIIDKVKISGGDPYSDLDDNEELEENELEQLEEEQELEKDELQLLKELEQLEEDEEQDELKEELQEELKLELNELELLHDELELLELELLE